jgi:hypothetical protein
MKHYVADIVVILQLEDDVANDDVDTLYVKKKIEVGHTNIGKEDLSSGRCKFKIFL